MENKKTKKIYMISRVILVVITFIIFKIMFIHEDSSWAIVAFIFSLIVFIVSFPSTLISKVFIKIGNRLDKRILKILYYAIILPALTIFLFFGCCCIISLIYDSFSIPDDFAVALGQALLFLFLVAQSLFALLFLISRHYLYYFLKDL